MIRNPVLEELRSSIHSRPIPWRGLNRASMLSDDEGQAFEALGKLGSAAERTQQVRTHAAQYAGIVQQLLDKDVRDDLVKYLELFVIEYSPSVPEFASALGLLREAWTTLEALLGRGDEQIVTLASVAISVLATAPGVVAPASGIEALFKHVVDTQLVRADANQQDLAAQQLAAVLQSPVYRGLFAPHAATAVPVLLKLVAEAPLQIQYDSLVALWVLSYDRKFAADLVVKFCAAPVLLETARNALKVKVVRVSIATLANLVRFAAKSAVPVLIADGALSIGRQLSERKFNDDELVADLEYVRSILSEAFDSMTTLDEYLSELSMHRLKWTPVHKNRAFWIENIDEFRAHDWALLRRLVALASESDDANTLAVACHDIASIIEQAPEASEIVSRSGGKTRLMKLIADKDTEVRFEALRTTQIMLTHIFA